MDTHRYRQPVAASSFPHPTLSHTFSNACGPLFFTSSSTAAMSGSSFKNANRSAFSGVCVSAWREGERRQVRPARLPGRLSRTQTAPRSLVSVSQPDRREDGGRWGKVTGGSAAFDTRAGCFAAPPCPMCRQQQAPGMSVRLAGTGALEVNGAIRPRFCRFSCQAYAPTRPRTAIASERRVLRRAGLGMPAAAPDPPQRHTRCSSSARTVLNTHPRGSELTDMFMHAFASEGRFVCLARGCPLPSSAGYPSSDLVAQCAPRHVHEGMGERRASQCGLRLAQGRPLVPLFRNVPTDMFRKAWASDGLFNAACAWLSAGPWCLLFGNEPTDWFMKALANERFLIPARPLSRPARDAPLPAL